ncbi:hypothetical protein L596_022764 [Steinernema carpocapsae]|uniref:Bestrophin homolog n=1 Tax=Steinernema carpocapsae TaxID=34508 RepID=A0A4U5MMQ7_STECR|nr:hypothetical protein L596_022764 [Steinernema carpocapsae]
MTEEEYEMYMSTAGPHGKWFIPIVWIVNLIKTMSTPIVTDLPFVYDWVKVPLVYTQVVAIATYGYFVICLLGRQPKLDEKSMQKEITILFPIFTTFQMLFYIGWLKVGQFLMNPFGEDDDDFELNYILDRNTYIANMMATELSDQLPPMSTKDLSVVLPHTRASFKIQDVIPKSHLAAFKLTDQEMQLIKPEDIEETDKLIEQKEKRKFLSKKSNKRNNFEDEKRRNNAMSDV